MVIVQMDRRVDDLAADAILVDNEAGAASAVSHLIDAGHSRIGIVTGELAVPTAQLRLAGYERALREHGIPLRKELVKTGSFHREHAIEDAVDLIRARPAPTAVFAANNILAEASLIALEQEGLSVPRDVSLVAFDDMPWMSMVVPASRPSGSRSPTWREAQLSSRFVASVTGARALRARSCSEHNSSSATRSTPRRR